MGSFSFKATLLLALHSWLFKVPIRLIPHTSTHVFLNYTSIWIFENDAPRSRHLRWCAVRSKTVLRVGNVKIMSVKVLSFLCSFLFLLLFLSCGFDADWSPKSLVLSVVPVKTAKFSGATFSKIQLDMLYEFLYQICSFHYRVTRCSYIRL